ncbi:MAG: alpha/beta fold hydrolase [Verrucomicrobia bacterium]|nr:MAG: alpha/beta fold hydrolase [Verrucomicrobiota bacterium]TAE85829.1 MAG: alpha/beta fold hydrolase [Verrucomicrobiota bacterium]TAF23356.1 MAG: alpha/beta fold hydrolase [Verrucomicrobiota bacterium]
MHCVSRASLASAARRATRIAWLVLTTSWLSQCAPRHTLVNAAPAEVLRRETFDYRKWLRAGRNPDTVIIGIHGFCGASIDYENLGRHLMRRQAGTALYAYEVRGQGRDPLKERRGDIDDPLLWFADLQRFTAVVREKHPRAKIIWFGESMGALIASHAFRRSIENGDAPPCDALVLSSPVVKIRDDFPAWKKQALRQASRLIPTVRLPLESLADGQQVRMTHDSLHSQQAETNAWHIEKHTLRLLVALGDLIDGMPGCARSFSVPTLVLHGGRDFFSSDGDVKAFYGSIPKTAGRKFKLYPESYHLLMYDAQKDQVVADIADWLNHLPRTRR